jgi:hypothetical protein
MYINSRDTIKINLRVLEEFDIPKDLAYDVSPEQALKTTIISLYKNETSYDFINYLDLEIVGDSKFVKYSKVYSKENIFSYKDI